MPNKGLLNIVKTEKNTTFNYSEDVIVQFEHF